jgi:hypothetical protein
MSQVMDADPIPTGTARVRPVERLRWPLVLVVVLALLLGVVLGAALAGHAYAAHPLPTAASDNADNGAEARRLAALHPRGTYIVIDSYANRLRLYRDDTLEREAVCSTGTGRVLRDPRNEHQWVFETPVGERRVLRKVKNPVWAKPDWAFIEEGFLPPTDPNERFDDFSLGDYALYMGQGYIIHGTIFQTLLGRPATHGCVRLGDKDLEYVYRHAPLGTRVFLY